MSEPSSHPDNWNDLRNKIIGLGERSMQKSYYPELQKQLAKLELFRILLDQSKDAILLARMPSCRLVDVNESACRQTGCSAAELLALSVKDILPGEAAEQIAALARNDQPEDKIITTELRTRDGAAIPVEMAIRSVTFSGTLYAVMIARDITERKQVEDALRESEQRLAEIIAFLPDATFAIDLKGRIIAWNHAMEEMSGAKACDMLGKGNHEYSLPFYGIRRPILIDLVREDNATFSQNYNFVAKGSNYVVAEGEAPIQGREPRCLWGKAVPLYDSKGNIVGAIEAVRDVTDQKKAQQQVRLLNIELEERVRERTAQLEASMKELDSFSYSVSHDLKAPLRAIDGFAGIILEEHAAQLDIEGRKHFERIRVSAKKMGQLINDLLSLSRLGRKAITFADVDMEKLSRECMEELKPSYAGRELVFSVKDLAAGYGDEALLHEVMINLLSNAVKYTRPREKAVIETGSFRQENARVYYVKDNGVGFDMAYAGNIFKEFIRLHHENEFEGTGIGLSIVQRIITRHGGKIWTESVPDKGSTFYFTLGTSRREDADGLKQPAE